MIIVIGGVKGGASKTTTACNAAAMRARDGRKVLLVDADQSKLAYLWAHRRRQADLMPSIKYEMIRGPMIFQQLLDRAGEVDDIIVDCGGHDSIELRMATTVADKLIVPTRPSQLDLDVYPDLQAIIDEQLTQNPKLQQWVMLAQVPDKAKDRKRAEVANFLTHFPRMQLMDSMTTFRTTYDLCQPSGMGVVEFAGKREVALAEMNQLNKELWI